MHDQAAELRQLVRLRSADDSVGPTAPLVVVSGGKGGVGTTTVAANLAIALARHGRRAVFVEADLDHGGHANLCGSGQHPTVIDVLAGRATVHESLQRGPSGIQVLCGAWASDEVCDFSTAAQDRFLMELKRLAPHADLVVIDAGSGRSPLVRGTWRAADAVVVVTTCDSSAVMEAYAAIKTLAPAGGTAALHTLVNLCDEAAEAADVQARIVTACRKFLALKCGAAGNLPEFRGAIDPQGVPIYPARSDAARALDRIADTLWAQLQVGSSRQAVAREHAQVVGS